MHTVARNSVECEIGERIRAMRLSKGATINSLAQEVRLTKGQLSKIENGLVSSPVSTLTRIAAALDTDVGSLFRDPEHRAPAVLIRKDERKVIVGRGTKIGHTYESLAFGLPFKKAFEPYMMVIRSKKIDPKKNVFKHPGHEFLFMVEGSMDYQHNQKVFHLEPGDGLYFDASLEHGPVAIFNPPVRFLSIISNPLVQS